MLLEGLFSGRATITFAAALGLNTPRPILPAMSTVHRSWSGLSLLYCLMALLSVACSQPPGSLPSPPIGPGDSPSTVTSSTPADGSPAAQPSAEAKVMNDSPTPADSPTDPAPTAATTELATFGNGCFWCTEAVLELLDGVKDVVSGYAGGTVDKPTYEQVCSGATGHAEVVQVTFDPQVISFDALCDWFFKSHDPTTLNRQGADVGTQYRSVIFFHSERQKAAALAAIARAQAKWRDPIVTELTPAPTFWPAEAYHQDYFRNHPNQGYCRVMIAPKLEKLGLHGQPKK